MPAVQWARLKADVDYHIRRGAWYRVVQLTPRDVTLDVRGKHVAIPRAAVEIVPEPPLRWTVVPRPRNSVRLPQGWGAEYAVCPGCRERAHLIDRPVSLRCPKCNGLYDVAWNEPYLTMQIH
ncbi:MAG TPA: hypothetical protein VGJ83_01855 [Gemmatimonadales bacterium]|jgi:hypothetical protein